MCLSAAPDCLSHSVYREESLCFSNIFLEVSELKLSGQLFHFRNAPFSTFGVVVFHRSAAVRL